MPNWLKEREILETVTEKVLNELDGLADDMSNIDELAEEEEVEIHQMKFFLRRDDMPTEDLIQRAVLKLENIRQKIVETKPIQDITYGELIDALVVTVSFEDADKVRPLLETLLTEDLYNR